MAYRNGTYVAFHAEGTSDPTKSDIKYFNIMKAWTSKTDDAFSMVNSHQKAAAVRDSSRRDTLRNSLLERLRNSKNMVLIIGETTRFDGDWVPFEIISAIDSYGLPVIAAYPDYMSILAPAQLRFLWPSALVERIDNGSARVIHVPFKKGPLADAIQQFHLNNMPSTSLDYYDRDTHVSWGLLT